MSRALLSIVVLFVAFAARADDARVQKLANALANADSYKIRATAAIALGRVPDKGAIDPLIQAIGTDVHYAVRAAAASALGRKLNARAVRPLLTALIDSDSAVRETARDALLRFHRPEFLPAFRPALDDESTAVRKAAIDAYAEALRIGSSRAEDVVFTALNDEDESVQRLAERALRTLDHEKAITALHRCLTDADSDARGRCAMLLGERTDPRSIDPLLDLITDPAERLGTRREAVKALRAHRAHFDLANLEATAAQAGDKQARATRTLGALAVGLSILGTALRDKDPQRRRVAALALADFGGRSARSMLDAASAQERDPRLKRQFELLAKTVR